MKELNYRRLLQAVHINAIRNGISRADSSDLDNAMRLPHPSRELAFIGWALKLDLPPLLKQKETCHKIQQQSARL